MGSYAEHAVLPFTQNVPFSHFGRFRLILMVMVRRCGFFPATPEHLEIN